MKLSTIVGIVLLSMSACFATAHAEPKSTQETKQATKTVEKTTAKSKIIGKTSSSGIFKSALENTASGDSFGYEVHAKAGKSMKLDKVGFYYTEGPKQASQLEFRINIYDMSNVGNKEVTSDFQKIYTDTFSYTLGDKNKGKFEYSLPNPVLLPQDSMVEIEILQPLDNQILWYRSNLFEDDVWTKSKDSDNWIKTPFAIPFFFNCTEV